MRLAYIHMFIFIEPYQRYLGHGVVLVLFEMHIKGSL